MKLLIYSDIVPAGTLKNSYTERKYEDLLSEEMLEYIQKADYSLINLECVLTDSETANLKWGSSLKAVPDSVNVLSAFPNLYVSLANNHIWDYGIEGYIDTVTALKGHGIPFFGAGETIESVKPFSIISNGNIKIGVYSCAENEFSTACGEHGGANPLDPARNVLEIMDLRRQCDRIIVLYHGGVEFYPYPTPKQQQILRNFVAAGADLVVCQHSHCIGCVETYAVGNHEGKIIYGQGNFLTAYRTEIQSNISDPNAMKKGMIIEFDPETPDINYRFYEQDGILRSDREIEERLRREFEDRSRELINDPDCVQNRWREYCLTNKNRRNILALYETEGRNAVKYHLKKMIQGTHSRKEENLRLQDYLLCESHLELLQTLLKLDEEENASS